MLGTVTEELLHGFPLSVELYVQQQSNLSISIPLLPLSSNIDALLAQSTDFSLIAESLTPAQAAAYPNVTTLPVAAVAIVPIYRLDALDPSTPLTLSGPTLALIYRRQHHSMGRPAHRR